MFGKTNHASDFVDKETLNIVKKKWESVKKFSLPNQIWKLLPNLYKDITRLFWGIQYFRNSLRKPLDLNNLYDESLFTFEVMNSIKTLPIKCFRSRRNLYAILKHLISIHNSLSRLIDSNILLEYQTRVPKIMTNLTEYFPTSPILRAELLDELEKYIVIHRQDKQTILGGFNFEYSRINNNSLILHLCYWEQINHNIKNNSYNIAVNKIIKRLDVIEEQLIMELGSFKSGNAKWAEACNNLKEKVLSITSQ